MFTPIEGLRHANIIGDSHGYAMFQGGLLERRASDGILRVEVVCDPFLCANSFEGAMIRFLQRLYEQQMLIWRKTDDGPMIGPHPRNSARPTIFFNGDNDLRRIFLPQLRGYDYTLENVGPTYELAALDLPPIAYNDARNFAWLLLQPYLAGVQSLIRIGMSRLAVHALPPPDPDNERFAMENGYHTYRETRYKGALLFNSILREWCRLEGVPFVDIWHDVTSPQGYRDERFSLDGTHLNEAAGGVSLSRLLEALGNPDE